MTNVHVSVDVERDGMKGVWYSGNVSLRPPGQLDDLTYDWIPSRAQDDMGRREVTFGTVRALL